jgi:hypothetical protein
MNSGLVKDWVLVGNLMTYSENGKVIDSSKGTDEQVKEFKDWVDEEADMGALEILEL